MDAVSKIMRRGVMFLALIALMSIPIWVVTRAQSDQPEYFPDTGHTITGKFYELYYAADNPIAVYGSPITDAFPDKDGNLVQYFQKARFELNKNGEIFKTPLGQIFLNENEAGIESINISDSSSVCRNFEETGYSVCYDFLEFFEKNGGVNQFGYPISNRLIRANRTSQYFEYALLEFYPERPAGLKVSVADLGRQYFDKLGENSNRLRAVSPGNFISDGVLSLDVRAFIARDPAADNYEPTIFVIVHDQKKTSLANVSIEFVVRYADGTNKRYLMEPTNLYGFTRMEIPVDKTEPGIVEVFVKATYLDKEAETRTSFRIWY
jgi:hypothetical protein